MARIHPYSAECVKSELDLFTLPMTQTSIERTEYIEIKPVSAITANSPIEFYIPSSGEDYIDLNNTLLHIGVKITLPDGGNIPADADVGLINYPSATLFSQLDVTVGDRLISQSSSTYAYRSFLELMLNYDEATLRTNFTTGLFYKDKAGSMDSVDPDENTGLKKRIEFTAASRTVDLIGPIHSDIFFQEKLLLNGVDIKLRFVRAKDEFCLIRDGNIAYKVVIEHASLFIKRVTVAPPIRIAHASALLHSNARYALDRVEVKTLALSAGTRIACHENLFLGQMPKSVVLAFVGNNSFLGAYDRNPFNFQHFNIEFLALYLDGQTFPTKPLQPDFQTGAIARSYYNLISNTGRHLKNNGLCIDRKEFQNGYTLFAFNLAADDECGVGHVSIPKTGSLRLEARFRTPLPITVCVIVYAVFDSVLEVSNRRQVLMDSY